MSEVVLASSNGGKLRELQAMLTQLDMHLRLQSEFQIGDAVEDGLTFVENAIIKARHACRHTGLPAIADDSGIVVDALQGAPGIYSARYAGEHGDDKANNDKLLQQLQDVADRNRSARFVCLLVYMKHENDPTPVIAQGVWEGIIGHEPQGENGFGYDPLFLVPGHQCTSAQLPPDVKNSLSHRGKALRLLVDNLSRQTVDGI